nr:MAG TPA: hypothetical protein [Caudoviricetes sp.]
MRKACGITRTTGRGSEVDAPPVISPEGLKRFSTTNILRS